MLVTQVLISAIIVKKTSKPVQVMFAGQELSKKSLFRCCTNLLGSQKLKSTLYGYCFFKAVYLKQDQCLVLCKILFKKKDITSEFCMLAEHFDLLSLKFEILLGQLEYENLETLVIELNLAL